MALPKLLQRSVSTLFKFSDLSTENTWEAFLTLKGKRLTGSFGSMHGLKIPEKATPDDMPKEELPYLEMLYRFVFGTKSYYNLEITKKTSSHVAVMSMTDEELRRGHDARMKASG